MQISTQSLNTANYFKQFNISSLSDEEINYISINYTQEFTDGLEAFMWDRYIEDSFLSAFSSIAKYSISLEDNLLSLDDLILRELSKTGVGNNIYKDVESGNYIRVNTNDLQEYFEELFEN